MDQWWTWQLEVAAGEDGGGGARPRSRRLVLVGTPVVDAAGAAPAEQTEERVRHAIESLEEALGECGLTFGNVVRVNYHTADADTFFSVFDALTRKMEQAGVQPASTFEPPDGRSRPGFLVEIEAATF